MRLPNIGGLLSLGKAAVAAHRPEILLGASIASTIGAVVMAAKGGYEARGIVDAEQARRDEIALEKTNGTVEAERLTVKEKASLTWICYLPAAGLTASALGTTMALHVVHIKEKRAIATAALMAIDELKNDSNEYKEKLLEIVNDEKKSDEEKSQEIEALNPAPASSLMVDADQLYLVKDEFTGRTFYSTENKIQNAVNEVNSLLNTRDVELNSFYVWAGVPEIQDGDEYGWNNRDFITVKWTDAHLDDGRPVRAFSFRPKPKKGYDIPTGS